MRSYPLIPLAALAVLLLAAAPGQAHFRGHLWIGPVWAPGWWAPAYPYYQPRTVIVERSPEVYAQPAPREGSDYWYYCTASKAYYPYVKRCPGGWLKVVPSAPPGVPEDAEED